MRIQHITTIAALLAALAIGCSKHSHTVIAPKNTKDLGTFELVAETQTNFNLGTGRSCTLVGKQVPNGVQLDWVFSFTNADGTVSITKEQDETCQAQSMGYRIGDMMIFAKVTVK
jgi:hypothetical protein